MVLICLGLSLIFWALWVHTSLLEIKEKLSNIEEMLKEQRK